MAKRPSRVEAWYVILSILLTISGVTLGIGIYAEIISNGMRPASIAIQILLAITFSFTTWYLTRHYLKQQSIKHRKELARKSIRKTFELLKTTSRTLDNIDVKANTVLNSSAGNELDKALAHELIQNVRTQVVEVYNDVSSCIEEWRDILTEEFDAIEKKELSIDRIIIDQITKTRKLHELEKNRELNENEIGLLRSELDRLAEKQRVSRVELFSESKKLVGAPITTIIDVASVSYSTGKFEPIVKQPVYISNSNKDIAQ